MMTSHHRMEDNGNGPDRMIEHILAHKRHKPQGPKIQLMVIQEPVTAPDEDPVVVNPSSPSAGPSSVEQRGRSRRQHRSRSRERAPPHVPPHSDEESATVGTTESRE